jgi:ATP-dependent DNA helicase HFM1/MER3
MQENSRITGAIGFLHAPPVVQGIPLLSVNTLPDRFRGVFPYDLFNAVQSKCFSLVYESSDNIVLSSPTGSGKTAIMELAICHLANRLSPGTYKVVYQAPTKALCAERKKGSLPSRIRGCFGLRN